MCHILAYVYLVEHKAASLSVFSTFFLITLHHFTVMATPTASYSLLSRDIRIRIRDSNACHSENGSRRLRVERLKVHTAEGLTKATACDKPAASVSLAVQPSSACPCPCPYRSKGMCIL